MIAQQCSFNRKIKARETNFKNIKFIYFESYAK